MTTTKRIEEFRVSWSADHEQYWQGHGTAFTNYTHCATGCGETLREAFEDAICSLAEQIPQDYIDNGYFDKPYTEMLADLTAQVKEPEMLDWDIVKGYCRVQGKHMVTCPSCDGQTDAFSEQDCAVCECNGEIVDNDPDCAVCAGEWHFYVNVDVRVSEEDGQ